MLGSVIRVADMAVLWEAPPVPAAARAGAWEEAATMAEAQAVEAAGVLEAAPVVQVEVGADEQNLPSIICS